MAAFQIGVLSWDRGSSVQFVPNFSSNRGAGMRKKKKNMRGCGEDRVCWKPMSVSMRHVESKANVDIEVEFKPSFGQYLKVMETVKTKRKERKEKLSDDNGGELGKRVMNKDRKGVEADKLDEKKKGLQPIYGGVDGKSAVQKFLNDAEFLDVYRKQDSKRETVVNVGNDEGRANTNVKWDRNHEDKAREKLNDLEKGKRKTSVWQNQRLPHASENIVKMGKDIEPTVKMNTYDKQQGIRPRAQISTSQKENFRKFETQAKYKNENGGGLKSTNRRHEMDSRKINKNDIGFHETVGDASFGMERAAFKTLEVIDEGRVSRMLMEERLQRLAKMLNGADIDMPEWMFSKTMRSAQIRFTDYSIMRVIQILGKLGNWRRALQVIEWLQMSERFKSHKLRFIYTAALDVLGKARRPVEAFNLFIAMQQQMSSYPDLVAYHSIAVTLGQAGHMKELFDVIDCMRSPPRKNFNKGVFEKWDPRLEPDIVVYNAVLNACVKRKSWEGAFWVLQQLDQQKIQLSSTTYGLVMEVMCACGKYNLVHEFFEKMKKLFIPNALTYRVLVNTLWKEGKPDEAVLAVNQMEGRGIVGSAALYYDLARCLCSSGRCKDALMQMEKICKVANKPLVVTYTGLIQACLDSGNVHDARFILGRMHGICSPNLVTYNIMLKAYVESGLFEDAKELYLEMSKDWTHCINKSDIKDRVLPDIYTFNTLLDGCAAAGRWGHFEYFYVQMLQYGFHFNPKRHLRMILNSASTNKDELVEMTWTHLAQSGRSPPVPLILERFCLKMEKDDVAGATSCINFLASNDISGDLKVGWAKEFKNNAHRLKQESVARLMNEIARRQSDSHNPILFSLTTCCEKFLRNSSSSGRILD